MLPDLWLLLRREPPAAVAILMCMHIGIALVTYNALIRVAPVRVVPPGDWTKSGGGANDAGDRRREEPSAVGKVGAAAFRVGRWAWITMMLGLGVGIWDRGAGRRTGSSSQRLGFRRRGNHLSDPRRTRGILTLVAMWLVTVSPREPDRAGGSHHRFGRPGTPRWGASWPSITRVDSPDWR
jgi:hypothetical protein